MLFWNRFPNLRRSSLKFYMFNPGINLKINPGVKHVELQGTSAQVWESVPEQHLDEIRRLSKLTGTTTSLHGPIVEASGVGEKGWEEINRLGAEKQIES